jgi:hypothetical protein
VFPDPATRERALHPFFAATVRDALPFGEVLGALDGTTVLAVAVWLPPAAFPWSVGRKLRSLPAFMRVLAANPRSFRTFMGYGANAEHAHPEDPTGISSCSGFAPTRSAAGLVPS